MTDSECNSWDGRLHPMRSMGSSGIWELFPPAMEPGACWARAHRRTFACAPARLTQLRR